MTARRTIFALIAFAVLPCVTLSAQTAPVASAPKPVPGSIASHPGWPVAKPEDVKSISLIEDGDRYWIVQILWDSERPGSSIPEKYLPK